VSEQAAAASSVSAEHGRLVCFALRWHMPASMKQLTQAHTVLSWLITGWPSGSATLAVGQLLGCCCHASLLLLLLLLLAAASRLFPIAVCACHTHSWTCLARCVVPAWSGDAFVLVFWCVCGSEGVLNTVVAVAAVRCCWASRPCCVFRWTTAAGAACSVEQQGLRVALLLATSAVQQ
jgi:hypothetical protein